MVYIELQFYIFDLMSLVFAKNNSLTGLREVNYSLHRTITLLQQDLAVQFAKFATISKVGQRSASYIFGIFEKLFPQGIKTYEISKLYVQ